MSNKRASKPAGLPTVLVASTVGGGRHRRAKPVRDALRRHRNRRRRERLMRLARGAGTVVSAIAFAAEMASTVQDVKDNAKPNTNAKAAKPKAATSKAKTNTKGKT